MKTKIFSLTLAVAAMAGLSACSDTWSPVDGEKGKLSLNGLGVEVDGAQTVVNDNSSTSRGNAPLRAKAANAPATIHVDNFLVDVNDANGAKVGSWVYSDLQKQEIIELNEGQYTVTARSHNVEPAAWDAPYYEGSQQFSIKPGVVTEVETVVCTLANIRVSVTFTEALLKRLDNPAEATVKITSEGNSQLTFTPNETRDGYFAALKDLETLRIDFYAMIEGQEESFTKTIDNVAKGQHRKLTFSNVNNPNLPPEELGTVTNDGSVISIDNEVIEDEPINTDFDWYEDNTDNTGRPGDEDFDDNTGDDPQPPTPPAGDPIKFTSEFLNLDGANLCSEFGTGDGQHPAVVNIASEKGFSHLYVKIVSDFLTLDFFSGLGSGTTDFDLATGMGVDPDNPSQQKDVSDFFGSLGLPIGEAVTGDGVTSIDFDITQFVGLIFEDGDHKFEITVVDKENNTKSMTLVLRKQ